MFNYTKSSYCRVTCVASKLFESMQDQHSRRILMMYLHAPQTSGDHDAENADGSVEIIGGSEQERTREQKVEEEGVL